MKKRIKNSISPSYIEILTRNRVLKQDAMKILNSQRKIIGVISREKIDPGARKIFDDNHIVYASSIKEKDEVSSYIEIKTREVLKAIHARKILDKGNKIISVVSTGTMRPCVKHHFENNMIAYATNVKIKKKNLSNVGYSACISKNIDQKCDYLNEELKKNSQSSYIEIKATDCEKVQQARKMVNAQKRVIGVVSRGLIRPGAKKFFEIISLFMLPILRKKIKRNHI